MTFDEAIGLPIINRAARRVWREFRDVPGFYLTQEDFAQIGRMSAWKHSNRLHSMSKGMLYVIALRDMYDEARRSADFSRTRISSGDLPHIYVLDAWLERGEGIVDRRSSTFSTALAREIRALAGSDLTDCNAIELAALHLHFFEDHTLSEVGSVLRISRNAAESVIDLAVSKLRCAMVAA